ncbi:MAG: hypothetical protein M1835_006930 [Candelina submexicana]|nr:MAG: hypothetical protein M1835_006930 [Candelina submexicana]
MLCANRPEGFGPLSHLYGHILTSCFLDTILIPLCTWLYLTAIIALTITGARCFPHQSTNALRGSRFRGSKTTHEAETNEFATGDQTFRHTKIHKALSILYYLLLLAQILMCILEIVRLALAHLGIGLLPFTLVAIITAAAVRFTRGLEGRIYGWKYLNLAIWVALAIINGVKIAEETKEGTDARKGSKYPVADQITDVSVMIGVYAVLACLEVTLMYRRA